LQLQRREVRQTKNYASCVPPISGLRVWLELARDAQGELRENGNQLVFELR
jgi:hypothetical protein